MKIKLIGALLIVFFSISVKALETDQYMMWNRTLKDSGTKLNKFIQDGLQIEINKINQENQHFTCEEVAQRILKFNLISFSVLSKIENFVWNTDHLDKYPKSRDKTEVVNQTIFRDVWLFKTKIFGVNLQVNNIYFGIDKLSHFLDVGGATYFDIYLNSIKNGHSKEDAIHKAIEKGIFQEQTYFGFWISEFSLLLT